MTSDIQDRVQLIRKTIQEAAESVNKSPNAIKLIAATKSQSIEKIREAFDAGITLFGENYAQEFLKKWEIAKQWTPPPSFYFIGHLQTNKVKSLIGAIQEIHSVDSLNVIKKIVDEAQKNQIKVPLLIEINVGEEPSKSGVPPNQLETFLKSIPKHPSIDIKGFMTIPPFHEDPEKSRPYFKRMKELLNELRVKFPHHPLSELSMGMSHDFRIAIEEEATQIRIGEAIFGSRKIE